MPSPDIGMPGASMITPGAGMPGAMGSRMKMSAGLNQSVVQAMKLEVVLTRIKKLSVEIARNMGKPTNSAGGSSDTGSQTAGMLSTLGGMGRTAGGVAMRAGTFAAGMGVGFMPNVNDAVSQRIMTQSISSLSGVSNASIVSMTNRMVGAGATSATSGAASAEVLQGLGISYGSKGFKNIMGQVGGLSALTGQSNEAVAAGYGGINSMNFLAMGIQARDKQGNLRDPSKISSEVYRYLYSGKKATVQNVLAGLGPHGKVTAALRQITGGDENLMQTMSAQLLYQAKNKGKPLNTSDAKNVMDNIRKLEKDDPIRAWFGKNVADAKSLQATGPGQVKGYSDALNTVSQVTEGFGDLISKTGELGQAFSRITAFATTLPMAGGVGATLAGGAMSLGGSAMMAVQARGVSNALGRWEKSMIPNGGGVGPGGTPTPAAAVAGRSGMGMLAKTGMFAAGAATAAGTSWAVPKLRKAAGLKRGSTGDRIGTMAAYAGGYAASGALMGTMFGGPVGAGVGAVLGTGYGLWKGFQESNTGGDTGPMNLRGLLQSVGFKDHALDVAVGVAMGESSANALSHNTRHVGNEGDNSFGLFQINMLGNLGPSRAKKFGIKMYSDLFDPKTNAKAAWEISNHGKNWGAWSAYTNGSYKQHMKANPTIKFNPTDNAGRNWLKRTKGGSGKSGSGNGSSGNGANGTSGLAMPSNGSITAKFGQKPKNNSYWRWRGYHTGIDFGDAAMTPVKAFKKGKVEFAGDGRHRPGDIGEPYGNVVLLDHGNGYKSLYAHLTKPNVKKGQTVEAGSTIGLSGATGSGAKGAHLHFEIRKGADEKGPIPLDPTPFLSGAKHITGSNKPTTDKKGKLKVTQAGEGSNKSDTSDSDHEHVSSAPQVQGASAPSIFSGGRTGFSAMRTTVGSGFGGDTGPLTMGSGVNSSSNAGGAVTINMNVTLTNGGTADARKLANEVKNILQNELRMSKIGGF